MSWSMYTLKTITMFWDSVEEIIESVCYGFDLIIENVTNSVVWSLGMCFEVFIITFLVNYKQLFGRL